MAIKICTTTLLSRVLQITLGGGCLACLCFMFGRWFFELHGELIRLAMFLVTLTAVGLITMSAVLESSRKPLRSPDENPWVDPNAVRWLFTGMLSMTLAAWSPSFGLAVIFITCLVASACSPYLLTWLGLESISNRAPASESTEISHQEMEPAELAMNIPSRQSVDHAEVSGVTANGESEPNDEDPITEMDATDPWEAIRQQIVQDATLSSNLTRWKTADGSEALVATLRCSFESGQQNQVVHLPFWPLFTGVPEVEAFVIRGPVAKIKTTEVHVHGLRLDIRLDEKVATHTELVLEVMIGYEASEESELIPSHETSTDLAA